MKKALFILLVLAGLAVVWTLQSGDETGPPAQSEQTSPTSPVSPGETATGDPGIPVVEATSPGLQREELPATLPQELTVTLRGRQGESRRLEEYVAAHGEVDWTDPEEHTTPAEGTFSFTFVPPPPYRYTLEIGRQAAVTMTGDWLELEAGTVIDLGDVAMQLGTLVTGRVLDTDGLPQEGVGVFFNRGITPTERLNPQHPRSTQTNPDGTFAFGDLIAAGEWSLGVRERQVLEPSPLAVEDGQPTAFLDIVVRSLADVEAITGIVVDEQGLPVSSATITRIFSRTDSERDGTFRLERGQGHPADPLPITVNRLGYEILTTEGSYPWGSSDVRLVLREALEVELQVTDAETGDPVEEYGARYYLDLDSVSSMFRRTNRLQHRGKHEGGRLLLTGVRRGINFLYVEPIGPDYLPSGYISFEVTDQGAPRQHVELQRPTRVTLEVMRTNGDPVSGTKVELVQALGTAQVNPRTRLHRPTVSSDMMSSEVTAVLLQEGTTEANGQLLLSGPTGRRLALRLMGPGHAPFVVNDLYLDPDERLHIEVPSGATVTGRIVPGAVLQGYGMDREHIERNPSLHTGLYLRRPASSDERHPVGTGRVPIDSDGSFVIEGIPPGDWDIYLGFYVSSGGSYAFLQSLQLGSLRDIQDGETRTMDLDVSGLEKARVTGRVFLNGAPLDGVLVQLSPSVDAGKQNTAVETEPATTGPDGSYAVSAVPGDYDVRFMLRSRGVYLPSREHLSLSPGHVSDQVFQLQTAELRVRVLGSDGETPVQGLQLRAYTSDGAWSSPTLETDDEGRAHLEHAPLEPLFLRAWPSHLSTQQARLEYRLQNPQDPTHGMVDIGTVQPLKDGPEITLTMPEGSGY